MGTGGARKRGKVCASRVQTRGVSAGLVREDQVRLEQPACVHASMDLLKIAMKLSPLLPSELLADALSVSLSTQHPFR
jgi:hypothetical protein